MIKTRRFQKKASTLGGEWWTSSLSRDDLRAMFRKVDRHNWIKKADIGGDQEQGFEQAFSSLAYSYIKDKSPRLIDFMIGFQLVDRNEDNTKAVGIFGFKVDKQWLYCPVFFLNGDLKGHELLYMVHSDTFVPMKENWVNYLISRKPHILGEPSKKNTQQMGGLWPNLLRLVYPPTMSKYGSAMIVPEWLHGFLPVMASAALREEKFVKAADYTKVDLPGFLSSHPDLLMGAFQIAQSYPLIKSGFQKFYGKDFFVELANQMIRKEESLLKKSYSETPQDEQLRQFAFEESVSSRLRRKKKDPLKVSLLGDRKVEKKATHPLLTGTLKIAVLNEDTFKIDDKSPSQLTEEEREKLLKDTVLVQDGRPEKDTSVIYNIQVPMTLMNPAETGIYQVLEKPGKFSRMLIVHHPKTACGRNDFVTAVRLDSPRNWINLHPAHLWVDPNREQEKEKFCDWVGKLPDKSTLEVGGMYIAIGGKGGATTPFIVREKLDEKKYRVDFKSYTRYRFDKPANLPKTIRDYGPSAAMVGSVHDEFGGSDYDSLIYFRDTDGTTLKTLANELHIPKEFKILKLQDPPKPKKDSSRLMGCCGESLMEQGASEEEPITPGNVRDIQLALFQKTASFKVIKDNCDYYIKTDDVPSERMTKKAALIRMIGFHGVSEAAAREIFTEVEKKGSAHYRIKYADGFGPTASALGNPGSYSPQMAAPWLGTEQIGYGSVNSIYPQEEYEQVSPLSSFNTDTRIYDPFHMPDKQTMQVAQEASQSGQKEIFDTVMISSMLKSLRQDNLIDKHLGDLMKALDKLGRILFMFYWHQEEFEDRFGRDDLPELEDSIRNAFEVLGDVVLFLKQKSVSKLDEFGGVGNADPNIEEAARN